MDNKVINKKTKIFSLVASVLLLSLFIGASFAYFGSFNQNVNSKVKVNVTIDVGSEGTFVSDGADFNLTVPSKNMMQYVTNTVAASDGSYLNVTLTSGSDKIRTTCTYDIVFEYDSSSSFYGISPTPITSTSEKELTLQVLGIDAKGDFTEEKNFNYETTSGKWSNASKPKRVIISGATISDASTRGTTQTYGISTKFYNLDLDQSALAGKTFSGTFYVDESSIKCDNETYSKESLYSKIEQRYKNNDTYVKLYDESDASSYSHPVYYFNGAVENNNVLFGGFCWKMVRTTDTGGIKMIYNGIPFDVVNTSPIEQSSYANISNDAIYPYTFDSTSKTWVSTNKTNSATGTITFTVATAGDYYLSYDVSSRKYYDKAKFYKNGTAIGDSNGYSGTVSGTIALTGLTTLDVIKVEYTKDSRGASGSDTVTFSIGKAVGEPVKSCNNTETDSQIGTSAFNSSYGSPAYVGYMHNTVYPYSYKEIINYEYFSGTKAYGDGATYASNEYTLTNATTLSVSSSNISTLVGKYTCNSSNTTGTCTNVWYIVGYSGTTIYYYSLSGGDLDGTNKGQNYVFGSSFTYANGTYTLSDTTTINSDNWTSQKSNVNTHHYTCLSSDTTCASIYYVYYIDNGTSYYITLENGKSVDVALNEMLYADNVNTKDSTVKEYIDSWYESNLASYEDKLEDTVFCNNRKILSLNGWNPNGGDTTKNLEFKNSYENTKSLACANETDRFSMSNPKAKLSYPIGLLSISEVYLAYNEVIYYLNNQDAFWVNSPNSFYKGDAQVKGVSNNNFFSSGVSYPWGVRPSVSLKSGTEFKSGDGSFTNPFVVE